MDAGMRGPGAGSGAGAGAARSHAETRALPRRREWLVRWFSWYAARYVRRSFHRVRWLGAHPGAVPGDKPVVFYLNHSSWWDPMICAVLAPVLAAGRPCYAPIDAAALAKYRFFAELGFFGVERGTRRGAASFLGISGRILERGEGAALWVTPQGRFVDARERPVRFAPGLGHLAARHPDVLFVPLAVEYVFGQERSPEVLIHWETGLAAESESGAPGDHRRCTAWLESRMTRAQDRLAEAAVARRLGEFVDLLSSGEGVGVGGVYDLWRRAKAWARGKRSVLAHGESA